MFRHVVLLGALCAPCLPVRAEGPHEQHLSQREATLASHASLSVLEELLLSRHPSLSAARARTRAERFRARERESRPPPELVYQQWAVPLERPYDLSQANMLMLGARVPVGGRAQRKVEAQSATLAAEAVQADEAVARNELLWQLRQSYAQFAQAQRELALHHEHEELVAGVLELTKVAHAGNRASAGTMHEARVMLSRLHSEITMLEAALDRARVRINLLAGRAHDAPLGPADQTAPPVPGEGAPLKRAELVRAEKLLSSQAREVEARRIARSRPTFMLGLDYMMMPSEQRYYGYGAMLSMTLPWLSGAAESEHGRSQVELEAAREDRRALSLALESMVSEARVELAAAQRTRTQIERDWLLHAREAYEVEREAWALGQSQARDVLDRLDDLLEAKLALVRAEGEVALRAAELAYALGGEGGTP